LNLPGHRNESRDLRSHVHFGSDDHLAPAPLLTPKELLYYFILGMRAARGRAPSEFERGWFRDSLALAT
jgi:hypothetical protein